MQAGTGRAPGGQAKNAQMPENSHCADAAAFCGLSWNVVYEKFFEDACESLALQEIGIVRQFPRVETAYPRETKFSENFACLFRTNLAHCSHGSETSDPSAILPTRPTY